MANEPMKDTRHHQSRGHLGATRRRCLSTRTAAIEKQKPETAHADEDMERLEESWAAGGEIRWSGRCGEQFGRSSKSKT